MARNQKNRPSKEILALAENLRDLLSRWVRTTRERTSTPSTARTETLRILRDTGDLSIAALAKRRLVKHQSMRLIVEQLAAEGAVNKAVDPADRRNQIVRITSKGRSAIRQEQAVRTEWIAALLAARTPASLEEVALAIQTLEGLLSQSHERL